MFSSMSHLPAGGLVHHRRLRRCLRRRRASSTNAERSAMRRARAATADLEAPTSCPDASGAVAYRRASCSELPVLNTMATVLTSAPTSARSTRAHLHAALWGASVSAVNAITAPVPASPWAPAPETVTTPTSAMSVHGWTSGLHRRHHALQGLRRLPIRRCFQLRRLRQLHLRPRCHRPHHPRHPRR